MAEFVMKRNDRRPHYRVTLTAGGVPVDLTAAVGAVFIMKSATTVIVNKVAMQIVSTAGGIVEYAWGPTDTTASGSYNAEIEVDWGAGEKQTFPSFGYFGVQIVDDLA